MGAIPDQPLVHRSWLTRGHFHPGPWASTVPDILMDTELTFTTRARVESGGSWKQGPETTRLTVWGHVELEESDLISDAVGNAGIGFVKKRRYLVIIPLPADTDSIPKQNDRVSFTDAKGDQFSLPIHSVNMPEDMPNHLEIGTDWWD